MRGTIIPDERGRDPAPRRRRRRRRPLAWLVKWTATLMVWMAIGVTGLVAWYAYDLPSLKQLEKYAPKTSVTLLDRNDHELVTFGQLYGAVVRLAELPPYLVQAVIATEDRRFYDHFGLDLWGMARAAWVNLRAGRIRQGGSTISQQLAKNLFLTPKRTLRRKVQETLLALWLEGHFSKDQILTLYLNRVYLGAGTYGVEAAARRYFRRSARDVTLYQAAMLAGLLKAPSRYNPLRDAKLAHRRARLVLDDMVEAGFLRRAEARLAARFRPPPAPPRRGQERRYFADWILERAASLVGYTKRDLLVRTTLDARLQAVAGARLVKALARDGRRFRVGQAALVALRPDGAVRAMVGGRDYAKSQFNRATQARRQPGSAFKPVVYLAALESGVQPDDRFLDAPVTVRGWSPRNYGGRYFGEVTVRDSLARSLNSVAVRISERVGRRKIIDTARRLGISARLKPHPSLALGSNEVTLLELTAAYATLANEGIAAVPYGILEIRDGAGRVLFRRGTPRARRVVARRYVHAMNDMLSAVIGWGTGRAARLDRPAAGKTGTSQGFRDAWFVGYTAELVSGVWMGNDDFRRTKGLTGGRGPARLWRDFMLAALRGRPPRPLPGVGQ